MSTAERVTVLVSFTGDGGVENMIANLVRAWVDEGVHVDVLLIKARGRHVQRIPAAARVIALGARTSLTALPALSAYLRREQPPCLLAAKDRAGRIAILARLLSGVQTRIVIRLGMHLSGSLVGKSPLRRWSRWLPARWLYPYADGFITVADEVADDMSTHARVPRERFTTIPNPVVPADLESRTRAPIDHEWFNQGPSTPPTILACGRLAPQKDFATLLRAFARVREVVDARLVILGEGPEGAQLLALARKLGLSGHVDFPGFVSDVLPWMARAQVFALSSVYEGAPNVLVEAMACGLPVVATDCPSGPREILRDGALGPLVPVGALDALAEVLVASLRHPVSADRLIEGVRDYQAAASARRYLAFVSP
jgi:glycosyltransferase involved in cell wall biosynthesis